MFVEGVTGSYYGVLPEAIGQPFRGLYALLSGLVGCLIGVSLGDLPGCYLAYWPTFQVFVWDVTWGYWPTFQVFVWVLPSGTDRLTGMLLGVCMDVQLGLLADLTGVSMRCYQGILTDLSSICIGCYLGLLTDFTGVSIKYCRVFVWSVVWVYWLTLQMFVWSVTGVYWPTFQVFVWSVTEHAEGIVVRFSTNWVRFSLARFCTDWVRFSSHTTEACPKHHSKCVQTNAYHYSTLHTTGEQTQDTSSLPWRLQTISIISLFYLSKFFLQYPFFLSSFFNLLSSFFYFLTSVRKSLLWRGALLDHWGFLVIPPSL